MKVTVSGTCEVVFHKIKHYFMKLWSKKRDFTFILLENTSHNLFVIIHKQTLVDTSEHSLQNKNKKS